MHARSTCSRSLPRLRARVDEGRGRGAGAHAASCDADRAPWVPSLYCTVAYYWLYSTIESKRETSGKAVIVVTPAREGAPQKTMTKNEYDLMHLGEMFQVSFSRRRVRERARCACAVLILPPLPLLPPPCVSAPRGRWRVRQCSELVVPHALHARANEQSYVMGVFMMGLLHIQLSENRMLFFWGIYNPFMVVDNPLFRSAASVCPFFLINKHVFSSRKTYYSHTTTTQHNNPLLRSAASVPFFSSTSLLSHQKAFFLIKKRRAILIYATC